MGDKVCNRCGYKGLDWDQDFHKKTGKWKLGNHKRPDGKWCNKPSAVTMMRKKHEVELCPYCKESNFGQEKLERRKVNLFFWIAFCWCVLGMVSLKAVISFRLIQEQPIFWNVIPWMPTWEQEFLEH